MGKGRLFLVMAMFLAACLVLGGNEAFCAEDVINTAKDIDAADKEGGNETVKKELPPEDSKDKGSPMHAWKAIASAYAKGETFTTQNFADMRNWSKSTRGYELQSLVAIGVLKSVKKGVYEVLVDATDAQIDQINEEAKRVVNRTGIYGEELGIDSHRLDAQYLVGGLDAVQLLRNIVANVTEAEVKPVRVGTLAEEREVVFVDLNADTLPASTLINGDIDVFTINEKTLEEYEDQYDVTLTHPEGSRLLASLVDTGILEDTAQRTKEDTRKGRGEYNVSTPAKIKTVLFQEAFVKDNPENFSGQFKNLEPDEIAVIIIEEKEGAEEAMRKILGRDDVNLLSEWGNRIIVMGVEPDSLSFQAFERLFAGNGFYDLRGKTIEQVLSEKDLVDGLGGTV